MKMVPAMAFLLAIAVYYMPGWLLTFACLKPRIETPKSFK